MRYSLSDDRIKLFMPVKHSSKHQDDVPRDYAELREREGAKLLSTALQRPEMSRVHLASMLRKALKKQKSRKYQKTYWKAFLSSCIGKNANSNDS